MTKDEFIQKVTLFGTETAAAYLVAFDSDNPTVESAVEELCNRLHRPPTRNNGSIWDTWRLLELMDCNRNHEISRIAEIALMTARMSEGEKIAALSKKIEFHLDYRWFSNGIIRRSVDIPERLLGSFRRFISAALADSNISIHNYW